jgi:hypothetical protein
LINRSITHPGGVSLDSASNETFFSFVAQRG